MMQLIHISILLTSIRAYYGADTGDFEVTTTYGKVKGNFYTYKDMKYNYFVGIPYAKPPINGMRFMSPVKPDQWTNKRYEHSHAPNCVQDKSVYSEPIGNEDCLYLNIYTPSFPGSEKHDSLKKPIYPVMVWFHDGDFYRGSRDENDQRPEYLVYENVTVVTINYRLGVFGFLSLGNKEIPGNMGLKDQVLALEWIKDNIAKFGGDTSRITLFGSGAGAASINYLMLCEKCRKDLFHRVILQSGSAYCPWASQYVPDIRAKAFGKMLGISTEEDFKNKLYTPSSENIFKAAKGTQDLYFDRFRGMAQFLPVIENTTSEDAIITKSVEKAMEEYNPNRVQIMIGFNNAEGIKAVNQLPEAYEWRNYTISASLPISIGLIHTDPRIYEYLDMLRKEYIVKKPNQFFEQYVKMMTDGWYLHGIYKAALEFSNKKNAKTYFYKFSYDKYSYYRKFKLLAKYKTMIQTGVSHGDEVAYLFRHKDDYYGQEVDPLPNDSEVKKVHQNLVKMWTDFAKTGNPTPDGKWEPLNENKLRYLDIGATSQMKDFEEQSRMDTWDKILNKIKANNS